MSRYSDVMDLSVSTLDMIAGSADRLTIVSDLRTPQAMARIVNTEIDLINQAVAAMRQGISILARIEREESDARNLRPGKREEDMDRGAEAGLPRRPAPPL